MGRTIRKVNPGAGLEAPRPKRVAAYARVSSGKNAPLHSLSAQVSHYSELIQRTPGWVYMGVYADKALSGTRDSRAEFQRLLTACRAKEIDLCQGAIQIRPLVPSKFAYHVFLMLLLFLFKLVGFNVDFPSSFFPLSRP